MDLVQTVRKEGSRGGRADFKWEDVKNDAQRENYLGHSLMAPVGRWQQGRDLNWYAKGDDDSKAAEAARIADEKRKLKEAEEDAMLAAMGLPVPVRAEANANLTPLGIKAHEADVKDALEDKAKSADEDKAKRRERKDRSRRHRDDDGERRRRRRSRSRSGDHHRERRHRHRDRSRSRDRRDDRDDRRRHRSRSLEYKRREDRPERPERLERQRERERNEKRSRSPSRDRERRRRRDSRSLSPYTKRRGLK